MKTSCLLQPFARRSSWLGTLAVLAWLLASASRVQAAYTLQSGTDYLNVYFNDGFSPIAGTDPTPNTTAGTGTPLASYSWLAGSATPGLVNSGTYNSGSMSSANASAQVSYLQPTFVSGGGSNSVGQVSPIGTSVTLNNTGSGVAEVRVDWTAAYTYSGSSSQVADFLLMDFAGTLGTYAAVAGEENFQVNAGPIHTATLPIGGDWLSSAGYPGLNTSANFWGYDATTPFHGDPNASGGALTINNGDTLTESGFLDLIIDPGSAQVVIQAAPEPSSLSLLGGLGMILAVRVRRNQQPGAVS